MNKVKKGSPKERILETATRLFYEQGYRATGINQIIKEARVAKASFYDHYVSKEELVLDYLKHSMKLAQKRRSKFLAQYDDPKDRLLGLFDYLEDWKEKYAFRGCELLNIVSEFPDPSCRVRQNVIKSKAVLLDLVYNLTRDVFKDTRTDDQVRSLAETVYLLYEAAINETHIVDAPWPIKKARNIVRNLVG